MAELHLKLREQEFCLIFCSPFCKNLHEQLLCCSHIGFIWTLKNPIVPTAFYKTRGKLAVFNYKEMCWGGNVWEMKDHMHVLHRGLSMIFELEVMLSSWIHGAVERHKNGTHHSPPTSCLSSWFAAILTTATFLGNDKPSLPQERKIPFQSSSLCHTNSCTGLSNGYRAVWLPK